MRSISRLFGALGTLADAILALAGVVDVATAKLRLQLAGEMEPAAQGHAGEIIDHADAEPGPLPSAATKRGGKAKTTVA